MEDVIIQVNLTKIIKKQAESILELLEEFPAKEMIRDEVEKMVMHQLEYMLKKTENNTDKVKDDATKLCELHYGETIFKAFMRSIENKLIKSMIKGAMYGDNSL